jgi:hypothetical protein
LAMNINERLNGVDLFGDPITPKATGPVAERFGTPPFTILDAKSGEWQDRKRAWASLGIKGEVGRSAKTYNIHEFAAANGSEMAGDGTSIFDPMLCETMYRWMCPKGGQIVDPFAGGSVRGIVAGCLGMKYWGCDIRPEQIEANWKQADEIPTTPRPTWVVGDALDMVPTAPASDFLFSCPPYGDLEVYSDDPRDLSQMEWVTFVAAYKRIILRAVQGMKDDSFACFVVGDFRDPKGMYRNFVSHTIDAFEAAGAPLYNEAILATPIGTAMMRVGKQFTTSRKLAKIHQNVLMFIKGDPRKATAKIDG